MILSYSSISTYQNCPLSYKFAYLDRLPRKKSPYLSFGKIIHKALYYFYNVPTPNPPSIEKILSYIHENWSPEGYLSKSEESAYKEYAEQVLTNFYRVNIDTFSLPVALEHRFKIPLNERLPSGEPCILSGIIDKVEKTPSGGLEIIDYKTGRKLPSQSHVDNDLQLSLYCFAVKEIWQIEPEKLTLYFVVPDIKMSTTRKAEGIIETKNLILNVAKNIKEGNFEPIENALCNWCDFQIHCPLFKYKFKKSVEPAETKKIIDEYVEVKKREKITRERIKELQTLIHQHLDENNCDRIYSEKNVVVRLERPSFDYDTDRLKKIMEPLGLWEKILKIDTNILDNLLKDDLIDKKTKGLIGAIKKLKSVSYALHTKEIDEHPVKH